MPEDELQFLTDTFKPSVYRKALDMIKANAYVDELLEFFSNEDPSCVDDTLKMTVCQTLKQLRSSDIKAVEARYTVQQREQMSTVLLMFI